MPRVVISRPAGFAWLLFLPPWASGHHATAPAYDRSQIAEVEGEITEVFWRNPHIRFTMRGVDAGGRERTWDIETNSVSIVGRLGLSEDAVQVGARVRVAGNVGKLSDSALWLTNMLLPDGREILFGARYQPRWSQTTIGAPVRAQVTGDPTGALGVFRVWTSVGGGGALWNDSYPLTPAAQAAQAAFDPIADDPTVNCAPKGMPYIMEQPYPMEILDHDEEILLRLEEYDTVRTVYMTPDAAARGRAASRLGLSVGRWDGNTLVVETTGIDYPHFDKTGIPQSAAVRTVERFSVNEDGSRLEYSMTVTDPATFTEPVVLRKSWEWRPGEEVRPYHCTLEDAAGP
jgi:hypothetical protein